MSYTPHTKTQRLLADYGIGNVAQRSNLAAKITASGHTLNGSIVERLLKHFSANGGDAVRLLTAALEDGSWIQWNKDLTRGNEAFAAKPESGERPCGSRIENVTESNPYGWDSPDYLHFFDHNKPGEWNAYRQCYNLTVEERARAGAKDHRRRGCSRWEVLGNEKVARPMYERSEVDQAKACPKQHEGQPLRTGGGA